MTALDAVLVLLLLVAGYGGFRLGFVARSVSWVGMAVGLVAAIRLVPVLLEPYADERPGLVVTVGLTAVLGGALFGQAAGLALGARWRPVADGSWRERLDRVAGAVMASAGLLVAAWVVLPAMAEAPSWTADQAERSALRRLLPEPPDALSDLRDLVGADGLASLDEGSDPVAAEPPPTELVLEPEVVDRVAGSVVRLSGRACGAVQEGSGFVAADGLVVTNAHVVAGVERTTVIDQDGTRHDTTVVAFDPGRDLAVAWVPTLSADPLPRGEVEPGQDGAVFGYPGGSELVVVPARVERLLRATGDDLYGLEAPTRDVALVAASLRPGASGGPLVDADGRLTGVAFAISEGNEASAYVLVANELDELLVAGSALDPVVTGACLR